MSVPLTPSLFIYYTDGFLSVSRLFITFDLRSGLDTLRVNMRNKESDP